MTLGDTWLTNIWARATNAPTWAVLLITMCAALICLVAWVAFGRSRLATGSLLDSRGKPILGSKGPYVWYILTAIAAVVFMASLYGTWSYTAPPAGMYSAVRQQLRSQAPPSFAFKIPEWKDRPVRAGVGDRAIQQESSGDNSTNNATTGDNSPIDSDISIRQESSGENSPNIVTEPNSEVTINQCSREGR